MIKLNQKDRSQHKHNYLSWTACYNDTCSTYHSDKNRLRWFLKVSQKTQQLKATW